MRRGRLKGLEVKPRPLRSRRQITSPCGQMGFVPLIFSLLCLVYVGSEPSGVGTASCVQQMWLSPGSCTYSLCNKGDELGTLTSIKLGSDKAPQKS